MRLAGAALNQTPLDWANNLANIQLACAKAQGIGVELLLLPELCLTGYGCDDLFLSEWLPEVAAEKLLEVLPWTANLCCVVGLPVRWEGATYNCAAVLRDGQILGLVAKQFLANDGVHYEARWFRPWRAGETTEIALGPYTVPLGDLIFEHQGVKFGFEICEDAWRPDTERPACRLMPRGVQLIVNPSASHFAMSKTDFRYQLVANASRNFQCTYLYANLLGNEAGRIVYDGEILIARNGHLLQRNQLLSFKSVDLEWADVDFAQSPPVTDAIAQLPAADEYQELNYALSLALFDYMRKSRTRGFVLSLSGGADSSMCAVAVAEMVRLGVAELGEEEFRRKLYLPAATGPTTNQALVAELLMCAYQGTENSSDDTFLSAKELAESIRGDLLPLDHRRRSGRLHPHRGAGHRAGADVADRRSGAAEHSGAGARPRHLAAGQYPQRAAADYFQSFRSGRGLLHDGRRHGGLHRAAGRGRQGFSAALVGVG